MNKKKCVCSLISETTKVSLYVYSLCFRTAGCDFASYFDLDFNVLQIHIR